MHAKNQAAELNGWTAARATFYSGRPYHSAIVCIHCVDIPTTVYGIDNAILYYSVKTYVGSVGAGTDSCAPERSDIFLRRKFYQRRGRRSVIFSDAAEGGAGSKYKKERNTCN